jgi:group I intron endonuclease
MKQKICGIYKITSPTNRIYIGQSIDIKRRINCYKSLRCVEQPYIYNSLLKYGWENHIFEILHECDRYSLNEMEKYYVDLFGTFNSKLGMNLLDGGGSKMTCSDETKIKMGNSRRGKKHSEETKKKISEKHRLIIKSKEWCENISKGKQNVSQETRNKIGLASKGRKVMLGKLHSQETKDKISKAHIGKPAHNRRPVIDINTGIVYSHKKEAADALGIKIRTLKAKLEGKLKNNTSIRYF